MATSVAAREVIDANAFQRPSRCGLDLEMLQINPVRAATSFDQKVESRILMIGFVSSPLATFKSRSVKYRS